MINVKLRESIKIPDNESLFITFNYDPDIVTSLKRLRVRHWHSGLKAWEIPQSSIHDLIDIFGTDNLYIDENVNLDYIEEVVETDNTDKWSIFNPLLEKLPSDVAKFTIEALKQVPSYFYTVQASSSGKYHPSYALGEGGLLRHTLSAGLIAVELFNNETVCGKFTNREKALMLSAIILHDTFKHGINESRHTVSEHPLIASKFVEDLEQDIISKEEANIISDCISTHMGEWNTDFRSKIEIMNKPSNDMQAFVHMCDYLASRKIIEINFDAIK